MNPENVCMLCNQLPGLSKGSFFRPTSTIYMRIQLIFLVHLPEIYTRWKHFYSEIGSAECEKSKPDNRGES
jgi:hypothetical protein